jgi:hypothetical protein
VCGDVAVRGKRIRNCVLHMAGSVKDSKERKENGMRTEVYS